MARSPRAGRAAAAVRELAREPPARRWGAAASPRQNDAAAAANMHSAAAAAPAWRSAPRGAAAAGEHTRAQLLHPVVWSATRGAHT
jgi:hypothetical protein